MLGIVRFAIQSFNRYHPLVWLSWLSFDFCGSQAQEDWLVAQTSEKKEVVYVDRKMGFDSSLGLWNADGNKKEQERTNLDRRFYISGA